MFHRTYFLFAHVSQKLHVQTSLNCQYTLPVAVTRSSSDDSGIRYKLPVLWMTSFRIMGQSQSENVMCAQVNQVVAPVGGRTAHTGGEVYYP